VLYAPIDIHKRLFQAAVLDPDSGEVVEERFSPIGRALPAGRSSGGDGWRRWRSRPRPAGAGSGASSSPASRSGWLSRCRRMACSAGGGDDTPVHRFPFAAEWRSTTEPAVRNTGAPSYEEWRRTHRADGASSCASLGEVDHGPSLRAAGNTAGGRLTAGHSAWRRAIPRRSSPSVSACPRSQARVRPSVARRTPARVHDRRVRMGLAVALRR
jgi:hypothetical protein